MEKISSKEQSSVNFDREVIAREAADTARQLIAEHIDEGLAGDERLAAIVELMKSLSDDNSNRFIVEALAQRVSYEREVQALEDVIDRYPLVA